MLQTGLSQPWIDRQLCSQHLAKASTRVGLEADIQVSRQRSFAMIASPPQSHIFGQFLALVGESIHAVLGRTWTHRKPLVALAATAAGYDMRVFSVGFVSLCVNDLFTGWT